MQEVDWMSQSRLNVKAHGSLWPWVLCLGGGVLLGSVVYLKSASVSESAGEAAPASAASGLMGADSASTGPAGQAGGAAPQALTPALGLDKAAAIDAGQQAAAKVVAEHLDTAPIVGPITSRPAFVSPMEWDMLQGVAGQQAVPAVALTRMVKTLRFSKQLEWLPPPSELAASNPH
jgi:hypothetical protein